ncbi:hypothetical protein [Pseudolactococcus piscium]|uniref:hypothetical protein n=1 Tax=Pseudolactococcus piscium TaxID=1364 RepID=UPI000BDE9F72|nr:hypothetical protein [Lactococcus piscium]
MFEKIKSALNFEKTLYHNRLSWKIILPQVFVKIVESLCNLVFQSFKIFISMMLSVIIMERLFNDRMPFDLIVSLFCMLMFFLLFLPFMKHVLGINTVSRYRSEIVGLGYLDENGKP